MRWFDGNKKKLNKTVKNFRKNPYSKYKAYPSIQL